MSQPAEGSSSLQDLTENYFLDQVDISSLKFSLTPEIATAVLKGEVPVEVQSQILMNLCHQRNIIQDKHVEQLEEEMLAT
jgi:hypothetical protein